jgi:hypothetical protein
VRLLDDVEPHKNGTDFRWHSRRRAAETDPRAQRSRDHSIHAGPSPRSGRRIPAPVRSDQPPRLIRRHKRRPQAPQGRSSLRLGRSVTGATILLDQHHGTAAKYPT